MRARSLALRLPYSILATASSAVSTVNILSISRASHHSAVRRAASSNHKTHFNFDGTSNEKNRKINEAAIRDGDGTLTQKFSTSSIHKAKMDTDTTPPAAAAAPATEAPAQVETGQLVQDQAAPASTTTTTISENGDEAKPADAVPIPGRALTQPTPMSKNQQKKMKRKQKWEDTRDDRKRVRKEKRQIKQAVKRAKKSEAKALAGEDGSETSTRPKQHTLVPVSLIFDCDFEHLMTENELISMSSQVTRSYASNRAATNATRIYVSSWGGKMRKRYETLLMSQHKRWQNVFFLEDDFQEAGRQASAAMRGEKGGEIVPVLQQALEVKGIREAEVEVAEAKEGEAAGEPQEAQGKLYKQEDIVYLTSDSPHTLTHLEPYTSYVIGGIVDKNREKGLCYRRAEERGIRTAKLPIGEYMVMASRQVLTTNQVVEIMLAWLETGDWATAFENVIPKRKGGQLKKGGEAKAKAEGKDEGKDEGKGEANTEEADEEGENEAEEAAAEAKALEDIQAEVEAENADTPMTEAEAEDDKPTASA